MHLTVQCDWIKQAQPQAMETRFNLSDRFLFPLLLSSGFLVQSTAYHIITCCRCVLIGGINKRLVEGQTDYWAISSSSDLNVRRDKMQHVQGLVSDIHMASSICCTRSLNDCIMQPKLKTGSPNPHRPWWYTHLLANKIQINLCMIFKTLSSPTFRNIREQDTCVGENMT